jgi:DNA-binding transcriptional regulator YiaG
MMGKCSECGADAMGPPKNAKGEPELPKIGDTIFDADGGSLCANCGSIELAIALHLAEFGPVSGAGFRAMRLAAGLRGKDVAALLNTRPATISQWENGAIAVDEWAWAVLGSVLLEAVGKQTKMVDRLKSLRATEPTTAIKLSAVKRTVDDSKNRHAQKRQEIVDALRPLYLKRWRQKKDGEAADSLAAELHGQVLERLTPEEEAWLETQDAGAAEYYPTEEEEREAACADLLKAIDPRFQAAPISKALKHLRANGVLSCAAWLAWQSHVEDRAPDEKWVDVKPRIVARYQRATRRARKRERETRGPSVDLFEIIRQDQRRAMN